MRGTHNGSSQKFFFFISDAMMFGPYSHFLEFLTNNHDGYRKQGLNTTIKLIEFI